jgi:hypothetical protein
MLQRLYDGLGEIRVYRRLPPESRAVFRQALRSRARHEPSPEAAIDAAAGWLCRAQDHSVTQDGGVARHFSVRTGWSASYPETTGYIVPTMLDLARRTGREEYRARAARMVKWLASIQMSSGAFQGGMVNQSPVVPVSFNTGQILFGLAASVREFGDEYRPALQRAADWLVASQDTDGHWRHHQTPFARSGDKTYYTHVAWALFEAERVQPGRSYAEYGLRNVRWALSRQRANGWVEDCCLTEPSRPLTHTLGYFLRGILEAYRFSPDANLLDAARRMADGLLGAQRTNGSLPGRLTATWKSATHSTCLTGNVQIAHCWMLLFQHTSDSRYLAAAQAANRFVRQTIRLDGSPDLRGGVRGSVPIWGDYAPYEYLNWAVKFFIDSQVFETDLTAGGAPRGASDPVAP